jgi:hypothetical protein
VRQRGSWLDQMVYRFQHRWETSAQYRATTAGVVGLVVLVAMCTCTGAMATAANAALSSIGLGGSAAGPDSANTGTQQLRAQDAFPTFTIPAYTPVALPVGTIPDSQTPAPTPTTPPTPTPLPTPTPCQTGCGGGGGGGPSGTVTASTTPNPWHNGQTYTVSVHTSAPNIPINLIISFANGVTQLNNGTGLTDGSGNYSYNNTAAASYGTAHVLVEAGFPGGTAYANLYVPCTP